MLSRRESVFRHTSRPGPSFRAIYLLFALEGASFAALLPRFPDLQAAIGLDPAALGVALAGIPAGILAGLLVAPFVTTRLGPERAARMSVHALAWALTLPGLADSGPLLFLTFFVVGLGASHTEIGLNAFAARVEAATGKRIMATCHGVWGLGAILGTALGGAFAERGVPLLFQSMLVAVPASAAVLSVRLALPSLPAGAAGARHTARPALPWRDLLPLCFLPVGIMIIEGVFMDWSNAHLRMGAGASPFEASLGYAVFALAMSLTRLGGGVLAGRFGERTIVVWSSLAAACGTLVFAFSASLGGALAGAAIGGAGTALVYPIALSAAARLSGSAERNIAAVSMTSFVILSASPAVFGLMAQHAGLSTSIALSAALALPGVFLGRGLRRPGS